MADVDLAAAVDALARSANPHDRIDAQRRLLGAGGKAVPALLRALGDNADPATARAIIETLGRLGDLRAVSPLRRLLRRPDANVACAAARALGRIPHGAAIWALRDGLESPQQRVRIETIVSLALQAASDETILATQAEVTLHAIAPGDVGPLVDAILRQAPPRARNIAFSRALRVDPRAAVAAALRHLHHPTTAPAARGLLCRREALPSLIFQLTGESAAEILPLLAETGRQLEDTAPATPGGGVDADLLDIVTVLINWYDPDDARLAEIVVEGLSTLGAPALDVLAGQLTRATDDERPYIVALLRTLRWAPTADAAGVQYLLDAGEWERITELGAGAIEPLLAELEGGDRVRRELAARALTHLGWEPGDRVMGYRLAIALGQWDALPRRDASARTLLRNALAEEREDARIDPQLGEERAPARAAMVRALGRFPAAEAMTGLLTALRDDPSPRVREEASRALGERGRDAVPLIAQALAREEGTGAASAAFRCDLIHLLARGGGYSQQITNLLRRLAQADPSRMVRDAAQAALMRIERHDAQLGQRLRLDLSDAGGGAAAGPSLGPRAAADVGQALRASRQTTPADLAAQLEADDPALVGRAVAALVSLGRAGGSVQEPLERTLLSGSLAARRAAAQALERLNAPPRRPEALAAYHLARGDLAQCEAIGEPARGVLRDALPLLDWRSAGAVAISLLRLGEPLSSPAFGPIIDLLARVASMPDTTVDETLTGDDRHPAGARGVSLTVSRAAERRAARDLLAALQDEARRLPLPQ